MTPGSAACGLLLGSGIVIGWPSSAAGLRLGHATTHHHVRVRDAMSVGGPHAVAVAGLAGFAVALAVGGPFGVLVGCGAALVLVRWLRGLDPAELRRRREQLNRDLPWAADLLAVAVGAGAPLDRALRCTADALGGPLGHELRAVAAALELGAPPALAWAGTDPLLDGVGRSFARAAEHGTPAAQFVGRLADDVRAQARADSAAAVRTAGVRALAPLGLCFLPAFLLLAVLPLVAGVASTLLR